MSRASSQVNGKLEKELAEVALINGQKNATRDHYQMDKLLSPNLLPNRLVF